MNLATDSQGHIDTSAALYFYRASKDSVHSTQAYAKSLTYDHPI
jgi:hypothetical protein